MRNWFQFFVIASSFGCSTLTVLAQWSTQTLTLRPGWNAVFLEIQPVPADCDTVFTGYAIESVWKWNRRLATSQFPEDANQLQPGSEDWLTYFPTNSPHRSVLKSSNRSVFNLNILIGGHAYLIRVRDGTTPLPLRLVGRPILRRPDWLVDSFHLIGFPLDPAATVAQRDFFANSPAHQQGQIYQLDRGGAWRKLEPAEALKSGEAYWVYTSRGSKFSGTLEVATDQYNGLIYGRSLTEQRLVLRNAGLQPATIRLRPTKSEPPPDFRQPVLAGEVPLSRLVVDPAAPRSEDRIRWEPMQSSSEVVRTLAPGEQWTLRLEVRRRDIEPFTPPAGHAGILYQSLIEVISSSGMRYLIPVTSEGRQSVPASVALLNVGSATAPSETNYTGLWVGTVTINEVSEASNELQPLTAVAAPFQFKIIMHVDGNGVAHLLRDAVHLWKREEGRFLLFSGQTGANLIVAAGPRLTGSELNNDARGRRISSAAFAFNDPYEIGVRGFGEPNAELGCTVPLGFDDPLNPFKHRFHPDHNNLDERYERILKPGQASPSSVESFDVERELTFTFSENPPNNEKLPGWRDLVLGGNYEEKIKGLHFHLIRIRGTFLVHLASRVAELNDRRILQ